MYSTGSGLTTLIGSIGNILNTLIPVLILAAIVWFIIGIIRYVIANNGEDKSKAVHVIVSGIIGLAVIVSIWGLVHFLQGIIFPNGGAGSNQFGTTELPCVPTTSNNLGSTPCQ